MSEQVIIIGLLVGLANYLFRYLPLYLGRKTSVRSGSSRISLVLDSIGIASICALLVVSSVPDIMRDYQRLLPTLIGFLAILLCFYKTRTIIQPTLLGALAYGLTFKLMMVI